MTEPFTLPLTPGPLLRQMVDAMVAQRLDEPGADEKWEALCAVLAELGACPELDRFVTHLEYEAMSLVDGLLYEVLPACQAVRWAAERAGVLARQVEEGQLGLFVSGATS